MRFSDLSLTLFRFFLPPTLIITTILYLYPILFDCSFPLARQPEAGCSIPGQERPPVPAETAPFRLLAFGDPQLEGDTSLPDSSKGWFPGIWELGKRTREHGIMGGMRKVVDEVTGEDIPKLLKGVRKRIDLWGNDLYLAHIYRSVSWWSQPTHVVVLGDLLGSQWISDEEFKRRGDRFWNTVFKGGRKVPRSITGSSGRTELLGEDASWKNRIIAVAGNHDIGYAGDIDASRISRFEDVFGSVNWDITFSLSNTTHSTSTLFSNGPRDPELRLVILNSMNLDAPAKDLDLQQASRNFASRALAQSSLSAASGTVLLTHIPFHKAPGVCVDETFFDWFPEGGIKEQNHLSKETSAYILNTLLGNSTAGGKAIVLNGHDHEGCDTYHYRPQEPAEWNAVPYTVDGFPQPLPPSTESSPGLREVTVRSMMGSYNGNAGFLSAWFDYEAREWRFEYGSCMLGVQHLWWGVHVFDLIVLALGVVGFVGTLIEVLSEDEGEQSGNGKVKTA